MESENSEKRVGFTYNVTMEQMEKHAALSTEEVFQWIEETATFLYELQTQEERERKYDFKPNKRIHPDLLRKDIDLP
ncbi:MAG: hypothetical protein JST90_12390 [Bacteroidetes bacterium]|nr:hypothetical protein [Bacteroidota bacterium]